MSLYMIAVPDRKHSPWATSPPAALSRMGNSSSSSKCSVRSSSGNAAFGSTELAPLPLTSMVGRGIADGGSAAVVGSLETGSTGGGKPFATFVFIGRLPPACGFRSPRKFPPRLFPVEKFVFWVLITFPLVDADQLLLHRSGKAPLPKGTW